MKQTINFCDFRDAFRRYERLDNFSYEGGKALFSWLEEYEAESGEEIELDVIGLCCDYVEMPIEEALREYNLENIETLREQTAVIWEDKDRVLFASF